MNLESHAGPHAIKAWFDDAAKNPSMINGAWFFMLEADYVWMRPMNVRTVCVDAYFVCGCLMCG